MKKLKLSALFAFFIIVSVSCLELSDPLTIDTKHALTDSDSVTVNLKYLQEISISEGVKVKFDSVKADSRCPLNVMCVWAGNGEVKLKLTAGTNVVYKSVNTLLEPRTVEFEGYTIFLKSLNPYPADAGKPIKQDEYNIDLKISRTGTTDSENSAVIMTDDISSVPVKKDILDIGKAEISGNKLLMKFRYSGGCNNHDIELYAVRAILKSNPPQINLYLSHNANGDGCEAIISREMNFDLENLRQYLGSNSSLSGQILLNIFDPGGSLTTFNRIDYRF